MAIKAPGFGLRSSYDVAFSPSVELLATVGKQKQVKLWDVRQRREVAVNKLLTHPNSVAFSPNGAYYSVKNTAGEIVVCQVPGGELVSRYMPEGQGEGCRILFSADSQYVIDCSWKGRIDVRRVTDLHPIFTQEFEGYMVADASASRDRSTWVFCLGKIGATARQGHLMVYGWPFDAKAPPQRLDDLITLWCARLSPDGKRLAVIQQGDTWPPIKDQGILKVFDLTANMLAASTILESGATLSALVWSPDGQLLGTVQKDRWTLHASDDLREVGSLAGPYPCALDFSPDGGLLALGSWERGIVLPLAQVLQQTGTANEEKL